MWVGNVPSDAGPDELRRFFTRPPRGAPPPAGSGTRAWDAAGVLSIFPISRSNCAFVNYASAAHLHAGVARFDGVPLRADPGAGAGAVPLVCRVRAKDDDLRAGVGAQRGMGMHRRWVKAQQKREREEEVRRAGPAATGANAGPGARGGPSAFRRPGLGPRPDSKSSSSSGASTSSSVFEEHFPERYFILKSLTQEDLDLSVRRGVWATQKHNEDVFDRAFRTSRDVYFVFSVNKSGEFYGYARMAGPVGAVNPASRVQWGRRKSPERTLGLGLGLVSGGTIDDNDGGPDADAPDASAAPRFLSPERLVARSPGLDVPDSPRFLNPERLVVSSPLPAGRAASSPAPAAGVHAQTAPAALDRVPPRAISVDDVGMGYSLDQHRRQRGDADKEEEEEEEEEEEALLPAGEPRAMSYPDAELEPKALSYPDARADPGGARPLLAHLARSISGAGLKVRGRGVRRAAAAAAATGIRAKGVDDDSRERAGEDPDAGAGEKDPDPDAGDGWGREFPLQWLCTERLPFERTRRLRNPWNSGREVKISRDGTELEPSVGRALLAAWGQADV